MSTKPMSSTWMASHYKSNLACLSAMWRHCKMRRAAFWSLPVLVGLSAVLLSLCTEAVAGPISVTPFSHPFTALENSGTQTAFIQIRNNTATEVDITSIAFDSHIVPAAGNADNMATNIVLVAPHPTSSAPL